MARQGGAKTGTGRADETLAVVERLHGAAIRLLRSMRRLDAEAGISGPRLSALSILVFGGPATLSALAQAEQVRRPTMTQLVNTLEAEGLVRKRQEGGDRRLVRVEATAKGRKLLEEGRRRRLAELAARFRALPEAERRALTAALDAFERLAREVSKSKS